jgi:hypothetical protein
MCASSRGEPRPSRTRLTQPTAGATGGRGSIAARSASSRSTGRVLVVRIARVFAVASQPANPGVEVGRALEVATGHEGRLEPPLRGSTMPWTQGHPT